MRKLRIVTAKTANEPDQEVKPFSSLKKAFLTFPLFNEIAHLEKDSIYGEDATKVLDMIEAGKKEEACEFLKGWHSPEKNPTRKYSGMGLRDKMFEKDGYVMYWNRDLGYVGMIIDDSLRRSKKGTTKTANERDQEVKTLMQELKANIEATLGLVEKLRFNFDDLVPNDKMKDIYQLSKQLQQVKPKL